MKFVKPILALASLLAVLSVGVYTGRQDQKKKGLLELQQLRQELASKTNTIDQLQQQIATVQTELLSLQQQLSDSSKEAGIAREQAELYKELGGRYGIIMALQGLLAMQRVSIAEGKFPKKKRPQFEEQLRQAKESLFDASAVLTKLEQASRDWKGKDKKDAAKLVQAGRAGLGGASHIFAEFEKKLSFDK